MPTDSRYLEHEPRNADEPNGLQRFRVPQAFRGAPATRFEGYRCRRGPGYDYFIGLRFVVDGEVRAWIHIDDWWSYANFALSPCDGSVGVVDHIRAEDVRHTQDWTSWFRDRLLGACSPLYPGLWQIAPLERQRTDRRRVRYSPPTPPREVVEIPWPHLFDVRDPWDEVVPMRPASAADAGRVKWWRKLARARELPPVLLMYCATMTAWVVLDGHDRLLAASLEGVSPSYVGLTPLREVVLPVDAAIRAQIEAALERQLSEKPDDRRTIEGVNRTLIAIYDQTYVELRGRVWPMPGKRQAWLDGLHRFTAHDDVQREVLDDMLFAVDP